MRGLVARYGWIGQTLLFVSVLMLVASTAGIAQAGRIECAHVSAPQGIHPLSYDPRDRANCPASLHSSKTQCSAKLLSLPVAGYASVPLAPFDVPAQKIRNYFAQMFSPDPPPPRQGQTNSFLHS